MSRVQSPSPTPIFRHISCYMLLRSGSTGASSRPARLLATNFTPAVTWRPPGPGVLIDPAHGARISDDGRQIIKFGKAGSNPAGNRALFCLQAEVRVYH